MTRKARLLHEDAADETDVEDSYRTSARLWMVAVLIISLAVWLKSPNDYVTQANVQRWFALGTAVVMFGYAFVRTRFVGLTDEEFAQVDVRQLSLRPHIPHPAATLGRGSVRVIIAGVWTLGIAALPRHLDPWAVGAALGLCTAASGYFAIRGGRDLHRAASDDVSKPRLALALAAMLGWFVLVAIAGRTSAQSWARVAVLLVGLAVAPLVRWLLARTPSPGLRGDQ